MDRYPSPEYLLGSMVEDKVPCDLAVKIARGYEKALPGMSDEQTGQWLTAVAANLGPGHPHTTLTTLTYPSDHIAPRYAVLASTYGWKENDDASAETPRGGTCSTSQEEGQGARRTCHQGGGQASPDPRT